MSKQLAKLAMDPTPRASLLRMARAWQVRGQINQAIDAYDRLLAQYPTSPEAAEATDRLRAIAQAWERQGKFRMALHLYEKLEARS